MQLPFLRHVLPDTPIVPLLLGYQEADTILELARVLGEALAGVTPLLVASTDLSHYFEAGRAAELDRVVVDYITRFDTAGLMTEYLRYPARERGRHVACGGGAAIAVMTAAASLGARHARVLHHADSGDVSGDKTAVVGYLAATLGRFEKPQRRPGAVSCLAGSRDTRVARTTGVAAARAERDCRPSGRTCGAVAGPRRRAGPAHGCLCHPSARQSSAWLYRFGHTGYATGRGGGSMRR